MTPTRYEFCGVSKLDLSLPLDPYRKHRARAAQLEGGSLLKNQTIIKYGLQDGWLLPIYDGTGYELVHRLMQYSQPVLHKRAAGVLREMGDHFNQKLQEKNIAEGVFLISSMSRTVAQQKKLSRVNDAATKGVSAHSYGAAFDVYFLRTQEGKCKVVQKIFESTLKAFHKKGDIYLIPESECVHITVVPD